MSPSSKLSSAPAQTCVRRTKTAIARWTSHGTFAASAAYWRLVVPEGTLAPGRTFNGSLTSSDAAWDNGSHYDVWTVTARAVGQRVAIDMESDGVDAYLRVPRTTARRSRPTTTVGRNRTRAWSFGRRTRGLPRHRHELRGWQDEGYEVG